MSDVGQELRMALSAFAARPRVLVAVDFDGTLAPLVTDPLRAQAVPGALEALRDAATKSAVSATRGRRSISDVSRNRSTDVARS